MAILTVADYQTITGQTLTGAELAAATAWCAAASAAIARMLLPFSAEAVTVTSEIYDAPPALDLLLSRRPVRSITSIYYRPDANGVVANFTSEYLIDNTDGDEYQLWVDDPVTGWSNAGIVRRIGSAWGYSRIVYPDRLAATLTKERGSIKITYAAGTTTVPADIQAAAVLAVSLLMRRKATGAPVVSYSLDGESISYASQFTADAAVRSPDVMAMLSPYLPGVRIGAST